MFFCPNFRITRITASDYTFTPCEATKAYYENNSIPIISSSDSSFNNPRSA